MKESFGRAQAVSYKGKLDLVTDTDRRSEEVIVSLLSREFPEHGILAEERSEIVARSSARWILDPLDGTTNYAHGYPFFCVSLAFELDGRVVWGAVLDPIRSELFVAERGAGTTLNESPVRVSATNRLDRAMLCTGFPYDVHDSPENNLGHFENFIKKARAVRRDGAAALDLCYVAMGRFDGFWEMKLHAWDVAAGCLAVTEAGGTVSRFDGSAFDLSHGDVLASNPLIHRAMLSVL